MPPLNLSPTNQHLFTCATATNAGRFLGLISTPLQLLKSWRERGIGPKFITHKNKILYPFESLEKFKNKILHDHLFHAAHFILPGMKVARVLDSSNPELPVIPCIRQGHQVTFICPFCGRQHWHGHTGEPRGGDGPRVPHCGSSPFTYESLLFEDVQYELREVSNPALAGFQNRTMR